MSTTLSAVGGGAACFGLLLVAALLGRGAMGYGDVKVGYVCGLLTGPGAVLPLLLFAFLIGSAYAAVALLLRIRGRKDFVAFTPFLVAGVAMALLVSDSAYLVAR